MTVRELTDQAAEQVARRDAEVLLLHVLGRNRAWLLAHPEAEASAAEQAAFAELVSRRTAHVPLQYLTGVQEFYGLPFRVSPEVLIPRPETELLVEAVLHWAAGRPVRVVDVGTGSGAIAVTLAAHLAAGSVVTAVDLSPGALAVARENAARHGLAERVRFLPSDLLAAVKGERFDVVVSNPPYVARADETSLEPQVRDHEPHLALFADEDGLSVYRRLIPQAAEALQPGGLLAMEFGFGQQSALTALLSTWQNVRLLPDLAGIPRVVLAQHPDTGGQ